MHMKRTQPWWSAKWSASGFYTGMHEKHMHLWMWVENLYSLTQAGQQKNAYLAMLTLHFALACLSLCLLTLTQEDHLNSQWLNLDFGFLQGSFQNILKSELFLVEVPLGRVGLFNAALPPRLYRLSLFLLMPSPALVTMETLSCKQLTALPVRSCAQLQASQKRATHGLLLCQPYSSDNTPFHCDVCYFFTHSLHPCFVYFLNDKMETDSYKSINKNIKIFLCSLYIYCTCKIAELLTEA